MKDFLEKYRIHFFVTSVFVFLIHGAKLHSGIIGIDTEDIIHIQDSFYGGWLNTGRQGLYALKWLMNSLSFQPYMAGLLTLIACVLATSAFFLLWNKILSPNKSGLLAWIAGTLFLITHPIITEQFYFTLQSVEICIGLFLTVLALYLITIYCEKRGMWRLLISALLLLLTFSIYQAFVVIYIFGTVSVLLLKSIVCLQRSEECTSKELLKPIIPYVSVFLVAFVINSVITNLFFSLSNYLEGQILWGKIPFLDNLRIIFHHMVKALTGYNSVHFHFSFGLLCLMAACLIIGLCVCFRRENKKTGAVIVVLFYLCALFISPFMMTLLCGGAPVIRSQLVLPLITGFLAYLIISLPAKYITPKKVLIKKIAYVCIGIICVYGIWGQTSTTMAFYYTEEMRYEQDESLGRELITEIDRVRGEFDLPVAVVGRRPFAGNNACVTGEIIGKSFFDHDVEVEPTYYWSTRRIIGFLHILGADYKQADRSKFGDIVNYSANMPSWPAEGSVQLYDSMVIVKLSDLE